MNKRFYIIFFLGCLLSSMTLVAQSDKQKKLEEQRQQILKEIKQFQALLIFTKEDIKLKNKY